MLFWIDSTAFTVASSNVLAGTIAEHDQILKFTSDCFAKSDCHCYRKDRNPKNQRHKKLAVISRRLSHARIEIQHTSILTHKYMATDKIQLKGPISRVSHARSILEASPDFRRRAGHLPLAGPPLVTRGRAAFSRLADVIVAEIGPHVPPQSVSCVLFGFRFSLPFVVAIQMSLSYT